MTTIKFDRLDSHHAQSLHELTDQEMIATVGGSVLDDALKLVQGVEKVAEALNPPEPPPRQLTPTEVAFNTSQASVQSSDALHRQNVSTAVQLAQAFG